jgi:hypothetical protein
VSSSSSNIGQLQRLQHLQDLRIECSNSIDTQELVEALSRLPLTDLFIAHGAIGDEDLCTIAQGKPQLQALTIESEELKSLRFCSETSKLASTLRELTLPSERDVPLTEACHLLDLKSLTKLTIWQTFEEVLPPVALAMLRHAIPGLTEVRQIGDTDEDSV